MAPTLNTLPPELLIEIFDFLPISSLISLTLVNKRFNSLIPPKAYRYRTVCKCEETAIRRALEEPRIRRFGARYCRGCRSTYSDNQTYFHGPEPICTQHNSYLESPELAKGMERGMKWLLRAHSRLCTSWITLNRTFCGHSRQIKRWKSPLQFCCSCDHCGHFEITCLVRVSRKDDAPRAWERSADGKWMLEYDRPPRKFLRFSVPHVGHGL